MSGPPPMAYVVWAMYYGTMNGVHEIGFQPDMFMTSALKGMAENIEVQANLENAGFVPEGDNPRAIMESMSKLFAEFGLIQNIEVIDANDTEVKIRVSGCMLTPATQIFVKNVDPKPPCAPGWVMAHFLNKMTEKSWYIEDIQHENGVTSIHFKVSEF